MSDDDNEKSTRQSKPQRSQSRQPRAGKQQQPPQNQRQPKASKDNRNDQQSKQREDTKKALQQISQDTHEIKQLQKTTEQIRRSLARAGTQPRFASANYGMADYDAEMAFHLPCSTYAECAAMVADVVDGRALHPKRFGSKLETVVVTSSCSTILAIPADGTGGYSTGNTIIVATALNAAYKGAVIFARDDATNISTVIGYVPPERDLESVSSQIAVLFACLGISSPAGVTGTAATITSQVIGQLALISAGPTSVITGKVAPIAQGRICPIEVLGPQEYNVCSFTATEPEANILHFSSFDPQNLRMVTVPNPANLAQNSSSYPVPIRPFAITATASNSFSAISAGYDSGLAENWNSTFSWSGSRQFWNLNQNNDSLRHMLFGDFQLEAILNCSYTGVGTYNVGVSLHNGDGTFTTIIYTGFMSNVGTTNIMVDTRGDNQFSGYRGLIISDIYIETLADTGTFYLQQSYSPQIRVTFLEIPAGTKYLVSVLSGLIPGFRLNVNLRVHSEVFLDPAAQQATFLSATEDPPYHPIVLPSFLQQHYFTSNHSSGVMSAASYKDTARRFAEIGARTGKLLMPMIPESYRPVASAALDLAQQYGRRGRKLQASSFHPPNISDYQPTVREINFNPHRILNKRNSTEDINGYREYMKNICLPIPHGGETISSNTAPPDEEPIRIHTLATTEHYQQTWEASSFACSNRAMFDLSEDMQPEKFYYEETETEHQRNRRRSLADRTQVRYHPRRSYQAASFGSMNQRVKNTLPFSFVAIERTLHEYAIIPLHTTGHADPAITPAFPRAHVGYPSAPLTGRSGSLAFLLAVLRESGFRSKPGLYTGEIGIASPTFDKQRLLDITFVLCPVACSMEKIQASNQTHVPLFGYFDQGWYSNGVWKTEVDLADMFESSMRYDVRPVNYGAGYPISPVEIRVSRRG